MKIKLEDILDLNCFVKGCEYFEGTVDAKQGRHLVNGKSFISMCSLDLTEPIDITINAKDREVENDFYKFVKKWKVA